MSYDDNEEEKSGGGKVWLIVGVIVLLGLGYLVKLVIDKNSNSLPRREQDFTMVSLPPPPPPPPPPVPVATPPPIEQEIPVEQEMIEQAPVTEADTQPEQPDEAPPDLGTGIKGDGPADGFGLSGRGNGVIGGGRGSAAGNRSRWGWYAAEVQSSIASALRTNRKTRSASLRITVKVWPDSSGRITRAILNESTGDAALDAVLTNEILSGLQLKSPPPAGMPSPIVLRISARRPQ